MEKMNALTLIITLVVGVILTGALLGPVISDATETERNLINDGLYPMTELSADQEGTYTVAWSNASPSHLTINGSDFDAYGTYGGVTTSIVAGENWVLRYTLFNATNGYVQFFNGTWTGGKSVTLSATGGTATITTVSDADVTSTTTASYSTLYVIDPAATMDVMKKSTATPYVKGDSEIYAAGITQISGNKMVKITGSIDDNVEVTIIGTNSENITVSDVEIDYTPVSGYLDLYQISKITFNATDVTNDTVTPVTYNVFIVPYEVTAELSDHLTPGQISLMGAIPVMVIVALLMAAVGAIALRRND